MICLVVLDRGFGPKIDIKPKLSFKLLSIAKRLIHYFLYVFFFFFFFVLEKCKFEKISRKNLYMCRYCDSPPWHFVENHFVEYDSSSNTTLRRMRQLFKITSKDISTNCRIRQSGFQKISAHPHDSPKDIDVNDMRFLQQFAKKLTTV